MMKMGIGLLVCLCGLLLTGCNSPGITIRDPILLGEGHGQLAGGEDFTLYLEMTEGEYFQADAAQSPYCSNFQGQYRLRTAVNGETRYEEKVVFDGEETLTFDQTFSLEFGDYNGDGNPDFTLGQRVIGNSNLLYQLYSVDPDGKIDQLYFANHRPTFFAAQHDFSIPIETADGKLRVSYYDTELGALKELTYQWENGEFVYLP